MSETELRRLRERVSTRKHYEDALRAHYGNLITDAAFNAWLEYLSFLAEAHHVATHGVKRPGQMIDTGAMESTAPAYDPRAMALYKGELRWLDGQCAPFVSKRAESLLSRLDEIVGEAAA